MTLGFLLWLMARTSPKSRSLVRTTKPYEGQPPGKCSYADSYIAAAADANNTGVDE
jgi:hypothetical protein